MSSLLFQIDHVVTHATSRSCLTHHCQKIDQASYVAVTTRSCIHTLLSQVNYASCTSVTTRSCLTLPSPLVGQSHTLLAQVDHALHTAVTTGSHPPLLSHIDHLSHTAVTTKLCCQIDHMYNALKHAMHSCSK